MTEKKKFLLRVDQLTYDALQIWADEDMRSVNAQIEVLLKKALKESKRLK